MYKITCGIRFALATQRRKPQSVVPRYPGSTRSSRELCTKSDADQIRNRVFVRGGVMTWSTKSIAAAVAFLGAVAFFSSTTRAVSGLQYFGYWRESELDNYICQIQDHANFSMTDESLAKANYGASYGVANWGLTAPNGGSPAPLGATLLLDDADSSAWGWCATHPCPNGISDGWTGVKGEIEARFNQVQQEHPGQTVHGYINLADGNGD